MFEFIKKALSGVQEWPEGDENDAELIKGLKAEALYSIYNGDASGQFGVVKILVLETPIVHLRVYKENFDTRPTTLEKPDPPGIGANDIGVALNKFLLPQGYGIAHLPVHVRDFVHGWKPVFIKDSPVTEVELEGYREWQKKGGGIFGG